MKNVEILTRTIPSKPRSSNYAVGGTVINTSGGTSSSGSDPSKLDKSVWDANFEELTDPNGAEYLYLSKPIVMAAGATMYAGSDILVPSIFEGLPLDQTTIGWNNGKLTVLGNIGGGISSAPVTGTGNAITSATLSEDGKILSLVKGATFLTEHQSLAGYAKTSDIPSLVGYATESWVNNKGYLVASSQDKTNWNDAFSWGDHTTAGYAKTSALADYVTLGTAQTIAGTKTFTADTTAFKGITIGGISVKKSEDGVLILDGNLLVTGGVTMHAIGSRSAATIMDGVVVDGTTIVKQDGKLVALGGGGSSVDMTTVWSALAANTSEQINVSHIPSLDWSKIGTGKPTTISGYGITDAVSTTVANNTYVKKSGDNLDGSLFFNYGRKMQIGGEYGTSINRYATTGGWASGSYWHNAAGTTVIANIGVYGGGDALNYVYIGTAYNDTWFTINKFEPTFTVTGNALNIKSTVSDIGVRVLQNTTNKAYFGWNTSYGAYLYNYSKNSTLHITDGGVAQFNYNTLLHAGNYNSYAPSLTGGGASGTWGISVSGSAKSIYTDSYSIFSTYYIGGKLDYQYVVIPLFRHGELTNHLINGTFYTQGGGSNRYAAATMNYWWSRWASNAYDQAGSMTNMGMNQGSGLGFRYVSFTWNGATWMGLSYKVTQAVSFYFQGVAKGITLNTVIPYYHQTTGVLNTEINNSIIDQSSLLSSICKNSSTPYATITDNVASATKLQTARTIFGRSFDGTADIPVTTDAKMKYLTFSSYNGSASQSYIGTGSSSNNNLYIETYNNNQINIQAGTGSVDIASRTVVRNILFAYRYSTNNNSAAIVMDKPGSLNMGIGADGTSMRMRFGTVTDSTSGSWNAAALEFYFNGNIRTSTQTAVGDTWANVLQTIPSISAYGDTYVTANTSQLILGWQNKITNVGYRTTYRIGSTRGSSGVGEMRLWVGNNDAQTDGRYLALKGNGTLLWTGNTQTNGIFSSVGYGYTSTFGSLSSNYCHIYTTAPLFYMDKGLSLASLDSRGNINVAGRILVGSPSTGSEKIQVAGWYGTTGAYGWYNSTYQGGIFMNETGWLKVYNGVKWYLDGVSPWGVGGHNIAVKMYNASHVGFNMANNSYTWGIYSNSNGNLYFGRRNGNVNDSSGTYYYTFGAGLLTITGNLLLTGGATMHGSDITKKNVINRILLPLDKIAAAPLIRYRWKDNRNNETHIGGSAQYTNSLLPECAYKVGDTWSMDYETTAYAFAVSTAVHLADYIKTQATKEDARDIEIRDLKRRIEVLERRH